MGHMRGWVIDAILWQLWVIDDSINADGQVFKGNIVPHGMSQRWGSHLRHVCDRGATSISRSRSQCTFLPRCMQCKRGLAIRILSVRPYDKRFREKMIGEATPSTRNSGSNWPRWSEIALILCCFTEFDCFALQANYEYDEYVYSHSNADNTQHAATPLAPRRPCSPSAMPESRFQG